MEHLVESFGWRIEQPTTQERAPGWGAINSRRDIMGNKASETKSVHFSNFGRFGDHLKRLADQDGYVPLQGDWRDFGYEAINAALDGDPEEIEYIEQQWWPEHLEESRDAVDQAERNLKEWQDSPSCID
jgi:hypothetical protein